MGWKCAPQFCGLTTGEPKPGQKHRMNLRKAAMEAGYERASKSDTLDRERSHFNKYVGYRSGNKCADDMLAQTEYVSVTAKDGTERKRKNRSDAVVGWALIINPPYEVCKDWDNDTYQRFYADSFGCMSELCPSIFRKDNIVMEAEHFDEGVPPDEDDEELLIDRIDRHKHYIGYARDEDGKQCGNKIDAKLYITVNENYPRMMRERGWDMDDLETTDYKRLKADPEYAKEKRKRGKSGVTVNKYIKNKIKEVNAMARDTTDVTQVRLRAAEQQAEAIEQGAINKAETICRNAEIEGEAIRQEYTKKAKKKAKKKYEEMLAEMEREKENLLQEMRGEVAQEKQRLLAEAAAAVQAELATLKEAAIKEAMPSFVKFSKNFIRRTPVYEHDQMGKPVYARDENGKVITKDVSCYDAWQNAERRKAALPDDMHLEYTSGHGLSL